MSRKSPKSKDQGTDPSEAMYWLLLRAIESPEDLNPAEYDIVAKWSKRHPFEKKSYIDGRSGLAAQAGYNDSAKRLFYYKGGVVKSPID